MHHVHSVRGFVRYLGRDMVTLDDAKVPNTPERLRLVNLVQWTALKCSRRSIRLQNTEFKLYVRDIERLNRVPTAASPASQSKRKQAKRQPVSPQKDIPSKKQAKSERKLPPTSTSPRHIGDAAAAVLHKELESSSDSSVLCLVLSLAWCCDLVDGVSDAGTNGVEEGRLGEPSLPMRWMMGVSMD
ncbi:hypothetical protein TNCV_2269181 [Trichonephila clavipes]|nr:hypothetical protein TNCV_2269181 [Trichonephila clavipes]